MTKSNKLKALIVEKGLTQGGVAKLMGIDKTTFSRKINNATPFTIEEAKNISQILDIDGETATEIFFG